MRLVSTRPPHRRALPAIGVLPERQGEAFLGKIGRILFGKKSRTPTDWANNGIASSSASGARRTRTYVAREGRAKVLRRLTRAPLLAVPTSGYDPFCHRSRNVREPKIPAGVTVG